MLGKRHPQTISLFCFTNGAIEQAFSVLFISLISFIISASLLIIISKLEIITFASLYLFLIYLQPIFIALP